ncbi:hypothetical protein NQZ68_036828 [Dissostichus eleginoides]|nr:hypothetical protein NQZ68_036828 [Dissostichus eleginoides]
MDVYFSSTPADSDDFLIASVLMSAAASITGFDIEGSSISVNGLKSGISASSIGDTQGRWFPRIILYLDRKYYGTRGPAPE